VLGMFNNGCNTILPVSFELFEATTGRSETIAPTQGANQLWVMRDSNADGIPEAAVKWPTYLDGYLDAIGADYDDMRARYVGVNTFAVLATTVVVNLLVFEPGSTLFGLPIDARLGYPTVVVLQDPTSPGSDMDPLSDFCTPLWAQVTLMGEVDGMPFRSNPPDGAYAFTTFAAPQPDEDNDGIENQLDPCPVTPNTSGWDPRAFGLQVTGDTDGDGLPDDCDPVPAVASLCTAGVGIPNVDEDCDSWQNRGDNCPLAYNTNQTDSDLDGIGDDCDPDPEAPVYWTPPQCLVNYATVGAGGTDPDDPLGMVPCTPFDPPGHNGNVDCDFDVDLLDALAWLKDWADVHPVPCQFGLPLGCDDPQADVANGIIGLLQHVADPSIPVHPCPVA
jgi:hypothetical protein